MGVINYRRVLNFESNILSKIAAGSAKIKLIFNIIIRVALVLFLTFQYFVFNVDSLLLGKQVMKTCKFIPEW